MKFNIDSFSGRLKHKCQKNHATISTMERAKGSGGDKND
jgi:hypothetical protein